MHAILLGLALLSAPLRAAPEAALGREPANVLIAVDCAADPESVLLSRAPTDGQSAVVVFPLRLGSLFGAGADEPFELRGLTSPAELLPGYTFEYKASPEPRVSLETSATVAERFIFEEGAEGEGVRVELAVDGRPVALEVTCRKGSRSFALGEQGGTPEGMPNTGGGALAARRR